MRRVWLLALAAFFGLSAAWAVAMPVGGHTDEAEHVVRAYGVVSGQVLGVPTTTWYGRPGADFTVPRSLAVTDAVSCMYHEAPGVPTTHRRGAECLRLPAGQEPVQTGTWVGRYHPAYYAVVGAPLRLWTDSRGIIAARLISALLCALCLASAFAIAHRIGRPLVLGAVLVGATPTAVALGGAVNPNGVEIAAGLLLWSALLALTRAEPAGWLVAFATTAAIVEISMRQLGPLIVGLTVAFVVASGRSRSLWTRRDVRLGAGLVALAAALALAWNFTAQAYEPMHSVWARPLSLPAAVREVVATRIESWIRTGVGIFGYTDTYGPTLVVFCWLTVAAVLLAPVLVGGWGRELWAVAGVLLSTVAIFGMLEVAYVATVGWSQVGRYLLAFVAGAPILAAFSEHTERAYGPAGVARLVRAIAVVVGAGQLWSLAAVMTRFQRGPAAALDPLGGAWLPPGGPLPPLTLAAGSAVLIWTLVKVRPRSASARPPSMRQPPADRRALSPTLGTPESG